MSETVAVLSVDGLDGWCAFNIDDPTQAQALLEEMRSHIDGSYLPDQFDADDEFYVTVRVQRRREGYVGSLPEFQGW